MAAYHLFFMTSCRRIERQIGDDRLQFGVLIAQLELANFGSAKCSEAFLPDIERGCGYAELARDLSDGGSDLGWRRAAAICSS